MVLALGFLILALQTLESAQYTPVVVPSENLRDAPFSTNGIVTAGTTTNHNVGSGYAVLPKTVLTAAHVVFDDEKLAWETNVKWHVRHWGGRDLHHSRGRSVFSQIWTSYAARVADDTSSEGFSNRTTFNADTAALSSRHGVTDGLGGSGMMVSDLLNNPFLLGSAEKMLVGYPIEKAFVPSRDRFYMHSTPPADYRFSRAATSRTDSVGWPWRLFETESADTYGGNSGGPLYVKFSDGRWYPVATFLGGEEGLLVRAIDEDVAMLVDSADRSAGGPGWDEELTIVQHPISMNMEVGMSAAFDVHAMGVAPFTYQWYKGDTLIPGTLQRALIIEDISLDDGGEYSVQVSNGLASRRSEAARLGINPFFLSHPRSQRVNLGDTVTFAVDAKGYPPPMLEWRKDSYDFWDERSNILVIEDVQRTDEGVYRVLATIDERDIWSESATLAVNLPPAIVNNRILTIDVQESNEATILPQHLSMDDRLDRSPDLLSYRITEIPRQALLLRSDVPLASGDIITQADINQGRISLRVLQGGSGRDSFSFVLRDSEGAESEPRVFSFDGMVMKKIAKIQGNDLGKSDRFGAYIELSGSLAAVQTSTYTFTNSVYIFEIHPGRTKAWNQIGKLSNPDQERFSRFGTSLAVDGDSIFVGVKGSSTLTDVTSDVILEYRRDVSNELEWVIANEIHPPDVAEKGTFGSAISVNGNVLAARRSYGGPNTHSITSSSVVVYTRNTNGFDGWVARATLEPDSLAGRDVQAFGSKVRVHGNVIALGTVDYSASGSARRRNGRIYLFESADSSFANWERVQILDAVDQEYAQFGWNFALEAGTIAVGAPWFEHDDFRNGSVFLYERAARETDPWQLVAEISPPPEKSRIYSFGDSLDISGRRLLIGAPEYSEPSLYDNGSWIGAAFLHHRDAGGVGNWGFVSIIVPKDANRQASFGFALKINADYAIFGAPGDGPIIYENHGAVHLFSAFDDFGAADVLAGLELADSGGWMKSSWFGLYNREFSPWIYHGKHGFVFLAQGSTPRDLFFFDPGLGNWWWTSSTVYPNVFIFGGSDWMYFFEEPGSKRTFFRYSDGAIISVDSSQ